MCNYVTQRESNNFFLFHLHLKIFNISLQLFSRRKILQSVIFCCVFRLTMEISTPVNDSILYKETFKIEEPNKKIRHFVVTIYQQQPPYKALSMTISSEVDHFFLFQMTMSEEDYKTFQAEHMLRPDFESFPVELVKLLEKARKQNEQLYFTFDIGPTRIKLKIKQNTEIRPITLLILNFDAASDEEVKQNAKKIIDWLRASITNRDKCLHNLEEKIKLKDNVISRLHDEIKRKEEVMQQEIVSQNASLQKKRFDLEQKFRKDLEDRLMRQDIENQKEVNRLNSTIKRLETEMNTIRKENQSLENEIIQIENEYESKNNQKFDELTTQVNILKLKISIREEDMKKNKKENERMADQIKELQQKLLEKQTSEGNFKQICHNNQHTINRLSQDNAELTQRNETIKKQLQYFQLQFNIKCKELEKANRIIDTYVKEIDKLNRDNNKLAKVIRALSADINKNQAEAEESDKKWKDCEKQLKEKNEELEKMKEQHLASQDCISSLYKKIFKLEQSDKGFSKEASTSKPNVEDYYYKKFVKDLDGAALALSPPTEQHKLASCKK